VIEARHFYQRARGQDQVITFQGQGSIQNVLLSLMILQNAKRYAKWCRVKSRYPIFQKASQISSLRLLPLNSLKQTFEVSSSKSIKIIPLNDLNENCRPIHQRLCK